MFTVNNVGQFQNKSELEIHSIQAKRLVEGGLQEKSDNEVYNICGLKDYGMLLNAIWHRIKADDPYAELALIEVERRISNAFKLINMFNQRIDEKLKEKLPGIKLEIHTSKKPSKIFLNNEIFYTRHAKFGAVLVGSYDLLIRKLSTSKDFMVINNDFYERTLYKATKSIRGVFAAPVLYKNIRVKRNDILQKTPKGEEAIKTLGIIPLEILNREKHSQYGPDPSIH